MNKKDIETKLKEIFLKYSKIPEKSLIENHKLKEYMDSLTLIELIFHIEETFDIEVPDERIKALQTYNDVLVAIEEESAN